jgi:hypothetical protein
MKIPFSGALSRLVPVWGQIKAARDWLTLLAVAAAAAWLYYQFATVKHDRDALLAFANVTCAAAGAEFEASAVLEGKKTVKHKRGELCLVRVRYLSQLERDTLKASNSGLAAALDDHARKSEADASAAARSAAAAAAASHNMERQENAIAQDNRVGPDWFDAINRLAGLQPSAR